MVRRFHIPPTLFPQAGAEINVVLESPADDDSDELRKVVSKTPLPQLCASVCQVFLPYVSKRVAYLAEQSLSDVRTEANVPCQDTITETCKSIATMYVARRSGLLRIVVEEGDNIDSNDKDIVVTLIGHHLTALAAHIGEKQAAAIYERLEAITDRVFKDQLPRGK